MARSKPTTLPIGTISEGTLRPEDLLDAYLSAADSLRLSKAERATLRAIRAKAYGDGTPTNDSSMGDADELDYDVEDLTTILENHTPDYCYFGSLEGDGACFGVWPSIDSLEDDARHDSRVVKINAGDPFPTIHYTDVNAGRVFEIDTPDYVMNVTDHGNVTLYRRAGTRWIEVWSVV